MTGLGIVYSSVFRLIILIVFFGLGTSAKRGCSAFGHSCFGGHGKRFDSGIIDNVIRNSDYADRKNQEYEVPHSDRAIAIEALAEELKNQQALYTSSLIRIPQRPEIYPLGPFISQLMASYRHANRGDLGIK